MAMLDAGALLAEVSSALPCGEDVEYDPAFLELERVVHGKPDVQYGNTVVEAVPPDWKEAQALALSLLEKSRDLRVSAHLARALLNRAGFGGFAEGLDLIASMLEQRWAHLYPQLDPDDDNDPTARVNALASLVDAATTLAEVREAPLAISRAHGEVTLRDVEYASGEIAVPAGVSAPSLSSIDLAVGDAGESARESLAALQRAVEAAMRIETVLMTHVGAARAIDLDPLTRLLRHAAAFLGERVADEAAQPAPAAEAAAEVEGAAPDTAAVAGASPGAAAPARPPGEITTREDVQRAIDRICKYYETYEPGSPVPMLLKRARRLVDKSFMEILEDLAPDGLAQARHIGGVQNEE
ncbi:type VI secretion system protein TssA [Paraburkholderia silviterrae]|uniref:Type VI secretion system protein TssA n=1 Tax=Paraburkholderia silviterrae TaxID=2528715 RepID=A0A4R5MGD3_9BURK|nr:type VI secretion system protein TssA [Paraburkholderia silviterrae]TDG26127.1 type VI secretion system protein TssA [Paraburkholderia silviterrae]